MVEPKTVPGGQSVTLGGSKYEEPVKAKRSLEQSQRVIYAWVAL